MSLYERCVELQLKLDAAQAADSSVDLLARAASLAEGLDRASEYFSAAILFRSILAIDDRPGLELKAVNQAVAAFRAGLSRHSTAAFQHQPATNLTNVARAQRDRVSRWVLGKWKGLFTEYEPLLQRVQTEHLVGASADRLIARARAAKLQAIRALDPIADTEKLQAALGTAKLSSWIATIGVVGTELREALTRLDDERAALSAEVREALRAAATEDGMPLTGLTSELLVALHLAGVDEHLVVRRR